MMKFLIFFIVLGSILIIGCSSVPKHEKWMQDGKVIGDITRQKRNFGYACEYKNIQGRLVKFEKRDEQLTLLPGDCCINYSYDSQGQLIEETIVNSKDEKMVGQRKYATHKISYSKTADGDKLKDHSYYDAGGLPVTLPNGYHRYLICEDSKKGKWKNICFFTPHGDPASATYCGIANVSKVDFKYVSGIGEVCVGIFKNPQGKLIKRKKISGRDSYTHTTTTYSY